MQPQLRPIVHGIEQPEVRDFVGGVFTDLQRLLGYLDNVKSIVSHGALTPAALMAFEIVRAEGLAAAACLDAACAAGTLPEELSEEVERVSFAVRHEVRTAFERVLPAGLGSAEPHGERMALGEAHDLLRNCFEQSTVSLARVFRPDFDGASLFESIAAKRDNSVRLYEDLAALIRSARHAEWHGREESFALFDERLDIFRSQSIEHLMEKDRDACKKFIGEYAWARDRRSKRLFLHRFACYLELLHKHVGMRSVLADSAVSAAA
ncbi:MAG TPA: hypothetical protein VGX48_12250 [Pyrinomonadaceae bacterium]|nr:hypothetical protein [Pyrinomonadaceae bacterium]